jgi:hypothetical protein
MIAFGLCVLQYDPHRPVVGLLLPFVRGMRVCRFLTSSGVVVVVVSVAKRRIFFAFAMLLTRPALLIFDSRLLTLFYFPETA